MLARPTLTIPTEGRAAREAELPFDRDRMRLANDVLDAELPR